MHFPGAGRLLMRAQHSAAGGSGSGKASSAEMPARYVTSATLSTGAGTLSRAEDARRGAEASPRRHGSSAPAAAATQGGGVSTRTSTEQQASSPPG